MDTPSIPPERHGPLSGAKESDEAGASRIEKWGLWLAGTSFLVLADLALHRPWVWLANGLLAAVVIGYAVEKGARGERQLQTELERLDRLMDQDRLAREQEAMRVEQAASRLWLDPDFSNNRALLRAFVRRNPIEQHRSEEFAQLAVLVRSKGLELGEIVLTHLVALAAQEHERELDEERYQRFRSRMLGSEPETLDDYLRSFLSAPRSTQDRSLLLKLLAEQGIVPGDLEAALFAFGERRQRAAERRLEKQRLRAEGEAARLFERDLLSGEQRDSVVRQTPLEEIDQMGGVEFGRFFGELLRTQGCQLEYTPTSGDYGADLIVVDTDGVRWAVQAKRWEASVGPGAVEEATAAVSYYEADRGAVVTNNSFTAAARELAVKNNILLIDRSVIEEFLLHGRQGSPERVNENETGGSIV